MPDLHLLSDVSIVIPTVSRPFAVRRHFKYWRGTGVQVFILDGAPEPIPLSQDERSTSNVHYIHTGTRFNERLAGAGSLIKTRFAALLGDDEFFLKEGLNECAQYLEQNPDVLGCGGKVLGFFAEQQRFMAFPMYEDWKRFPVDANDVRSRLDFALPPSKAHKVQYSLFRTEIWSEIFTASYRDFYSCGYVYERTLNYYAAILGRTELIDCVLWMRSLENPPLSTVNVPRHGKHDFHSWGTEPEFVHEVEHWRSKSRELLAQVPDLSPTDVEYYVTRFVDGGIQRHLTKVAKNRRQLSRKLGSLLIAAAPAPIKRLAKRALPSSLLRFSGWQGMTTGELLRQMNLKAIRVGRNSLHEIEQLVLKG